MYLDLKMKKSKTKWFLNLIFFLILSFFTLMIIIIYKGYNTPLPILPIGNKDFTVMALKEKNGPFSFLVIGDTHLSHTANELIQKALNSGEASFMIILGDIVSWPDLRHHNLFLKTMASLIKPSLPVFLVPGNHDIDYDSKIKDEKYRVSPQIYESLYGARNFHFIFKNCLFIICGIDPKHPEEYLNYLRNTLSEKGKESKYIFLFLHNPPGRIGRFEYVSLPNEGTFFNLLDTYPVSGCFFGDYHAYWRGQWKGKNLIISGGGGGRLKSYQPPWGKFHHILKITVDQEFMSEEIIISKGEGISLLWRLKKFIVLNLFPFLNGRLWIVYIIFLSFLGGGIYSAIMLFFNIKKRRIQVEKK